MGTVGRGARVCVRTVSTGMMAVLYLCVILDYMSVSQVVGKIENRNGTFTWISNMVKLGSTRRQCCTSDCPKRKPSKKTTGDVGSHADFSKHTR